MSKYPYLVPRGGARWPTNSDLLRGLNAAGERLAKEQKTPGLRIFIVSGLRTYSEQVALYRAYLEGRGNLAARPGTSRHESGNAADCGITGMGPYVSIGLAPGAVNALRANGVNLTVYSEPWHAEAGGTHRWPGRVAKHQTMRKGDRGPSVWRLQRFLKITQDSAFGPRTQNAVKKFQKECGLAADGVVGQKTWTQILKRGG